MKISVALLASMLFLAVGEALAFGGIAVDEQTPAQRPYHAVVSGLSSKEAASAASVERCRQAGGRQCRAVGWFATCGAFAATAGQWGYGYGATKAKATADALAMCGSNSCNLLSAECEDVASVAAAAGMPANAPQAAPRPTLPSVDGVWRSTSGNAFQVASQGLQVFVTMIDKNGQRKQGSGRWLRPGEVFDYSLPGFPGVGTATVVSPGQISVNWDGKITIWQRN